MQLRLIVALGLTAFTASPVLAQTDKAGNDRNGFYYEAHFTSVVSGDRQVRGMSWHCKDNSCGTTNKVSAATGDDMMSCKALVAWKGPLTAYSRSGKAYSATQLGECNQPPQTVTHLPPSALKPQGSAPKLTNPPSVKPPG